MSSPFAVREAARAAARAAAVLERTRRPRLLLLAAALFPVGACASAPTPPPDFAPRLGVDLAAMQRTASGLWYHDVVVGTGETLRSGHVATVHYTGWLADGTKFDSSRDRREPITFPVGGDRVIDGWDEGLPGMRVGGTRRLVVPPELAYGRRGAGDGVIPPNATLVFEIQLLGLR